MVVVGDGLVENCRACFSQRGYGIRLHRRSELLACPQCGSLYKVNAGLLESVSP